MAKGSGGIAERLLVDHPPQRGRHPGALIQGKRAGVAGSVQGVRCSGTDMKLSLVEFPADDPERALPPGPACWEPRWPTGPRPRAAVGRPGRAGRQSGFIAVGRVRATRCLYRTSRWPTSTLRFSASSSSAARSSTQGRSGPSATGGQPVLRLVPPGLSDVVFIFTRGDTPGAIKSDGTLVVWGADTVVHLTGAELPARP